MRVSVRTEVDVAVCDRSVRSVALLVEVERELRSGLLAVAQHREVQAVDERQQRTKKEKPALSEMKHSRKV